jgi:hypothetical protein
MANEITISTSMRLVNGLLTSIANSKQTQFNQTTARGGGPGVVDVGTSEENINFGDIVPGFVRFTNMDATNFVRLRFSTGVNAIRLVANGGTSLIYVDSGVTVIAIADTATCRVLVEAFNS